jgi:hypothetical protein
LAAGQKQLLGAPVLAEPQRWSLDGLALLMLELELLERLGVLRLLELLEVLEVPGLLELQEVMGMSRVWEIRCRG